MIPYCHYCRTCRVYYECTHEDPEMVAAYCPVCGHRLLLMYDSLCDAKLKGGLSANEIGQGTVRYGTETEAP